MIDPVHCLMTEEVDMDTQEIYLPGWYFWDETWCYRHGPFSTKEEADRACKVYAICLDVQPDQIWSDSALDEDGEKIGRVRVNLVLNGMVSYIKLDYDGAPFGCMHLKDFLRWMAPEVKP